ncbi:MAG: AAA family ATPase [bacterium]|nr:AAA family ATPase [bacterium]
MIKKLEIDGYRLLDGFEADLGDLTVVIGRNGTGKSTLLDCLHLISQCAGYPLNDVLLWHQGLSSLASAGKESRTLGWRILFDGSDGKGLWGSLPPKEGQELLYEVRLERAPNWTAVPAYEVLRSAEPFPGYGQPFKYLESRAGRRKIFDTSQKRLAELPLFPEEAPTGEVEHAMPAADLSPKGPSLLLSEARLRENYPVASSVRTLFASFAFYPGFKVEAQAPSRQPSQVSPMQVLLPTGDNVSSVLHEIFTRVDFRDAAEEVRGYLRSAYEWVEEIGAETWWGGPGMVIVRTREAGMQRPMNVWELSDGMLRFLCLEAALLNPFLPPFVAIDEPEVGLHPGLLPIVADMVKTASERAQVLVTTQSPDLLQCFELDQVAVMTREGTYAKWFRPGTRESLRKMLEAVGGEALADLHRSGELEAMP